MCVISVLVHWWSVFRLYVRKVKWTFHADSCIVILMCVVSHCFDIICIVLLYSVRAALETIDRLTDSLDLTDYASRIIHPLVRTLDTTPDLHKSAMDTLTSLVVQMGRKYQIFIPMVNKVLTRHRVSHQGYDKLLSKIIKVRETRVLRLVN